MQDTNIISLLHKNGLPSIKISKQTQKIIYKLHQQIIEGYNFIKTVLIEKQYKEIHNPIYIPTNYKTILPNNILTHINNKCKYELCFDIHNNQLETNKIKIIFYLENKNITQKLLKKYEEYVNHMLVWLYVVHQYNTKKCFNELTIYIYHTSLLKKLPNNQNIKEILNINNINTAFTTTCPKNSVIVIFRKEEWFKVFIHETFHNFALDFSDIELTKQHNNILNIFHVKSNVNLFESYAEFWARILNVLFCSIWITNTNTKWFNIFEICMNVERTFSIIQMVKILKYMNLTYDELISYSNHINPNYNEETNILAYYIITTILINNYSIFLDWLQNNNCIIQFNSLRTASVVNKFVAYIKQKYNAKNLIQNIHFIENNKFLQNKINHITLRMTVCELN